MAVLIDIKRMATIENCQMQMEKRRWNYANSDVFAPAVNFRTDTLFSMLSSSINHFFNYSDFVPVDKGARFRPECVAGRCQTVHQYLSETLHALLYAENPSSLMSDTSGA